jgi:hypothetical protein
MADGSSRRKKKADRGFTSILRLTALTFVVGLVLLCCTGGALGPERQGLGLLVVLLAVPVVVIQVGLSDRRVIRPGFPGDTALGVTLVLLVWVSSVALLGSVAGAYVRLEYPASYYGHFGTRVADIHLPDKCDLTINTRTGEKIECDAATWTVNGVAQTGSAFLSDDDVHTDHGDFLPDSALTGYAIGDAVYTTKLVGTPSSIGYWGAVPLWVLPVALVMAVLSGWIFRRLDRFGRAAGPGPSPQATPTAGSPDPSAPPGSAGPTR